MFHHFMMNYYETSNMHVYCCVLLNELLADYILLVKFVSFSMFIHHVLCIYVINTGLNANLSSGVHGLVTVLILYICTNYLFDTMILYLSVRYSVNINAFQRPNTFSAVCSTH